MQSMKTGIVDTGGGLRGVYAAGVFDFCMDRGLRFDVCIGVSAGSANVSSYIAGQKGRNYPFYTEYPFRKEYMGLGNLLCGKGYLNLEYIYGTLSRSGGENPLDYRAFAQSPAAFFAVATDARTGCPRYFGKEHMHPDDYSVLKASSALPVICRPCVIQGRPYFDGALGDAIPIEKAFALGCDKVVLILTKPRDVPRTSGKDRLFAAILQRKYPVAADRLRGRAAQYNRGVALAREYEKAGRLLIIAPDETCGVDTLTRDREALKRLYEKGFRDGEKIVSFLP